ncbi:MAG: hypothetical protein WBG43_00835 [Marinifilaceae bacterium]
MFPFKILLKRRIFLNSSCLDRHCDILPFFKKEFIDRKADNVYIKNNLLEFTNKLFKIEEDWNIMYAIDKGSLIYIKEEDGSIEIQYKFSILRTILLCLFAALLSFVFLHKWDDALICFCWLAGMNWLITLFRQVRMLKQLSLKLERKLNTGL